MRQALMLLLALSLATPAAAQPHQRGHAHGHGAAAPYAGLQERRIKALSAEQVDDLLAGRGMSLALAAELNGHPGPMHVLEHAAALNLTTAQIATAEALRDRMAATAQALGARIVAAEAELDALFAEDRADPARLAALTSTLGGLQGRLREVHLAAHIGMRAALTAEQRRAYDGLRGYAPR